MRYFTYDLVAAANDWVRQSRVSHRKAEKRFDSAVKKYQRQLDGLEHRVSRGAWQFFRYGFGSNSLHDARLLALKIGDGVTFTPSGRSPFLLNRQHTTAVIEFLNYEQDFHYIFDLRGVRSLKGDLFIDKQSFAESLGDLYIYELSDGGNDRLRLGFLFATGATIVVEFKKMVFRRKRINRSYPVTDIYQ